MDILSKYRKILINGLKKDYPDNNFENISFEFAYIAYFSNSYFMHVHVKKIVV